MVHGQCRLNVAVATQGSASTPRRRRCAPASIINVAGRPVRPPPSGPRLGGCGGCLVHLHVAHPHQRRVQEPQHGTAPRPPRPTGLPGLGGGGGPPGVGPRPSAGGNEGRPAARAAVAGTVGGATPQGPSPGAVGAEQFVRQRGQVAGPHRDAEVAGAQAGPDSGDEVGPLGLGIVDPPGRLGGAARRRPRSGR